MVVVAVFPGARAFRGRGAAFEGGAAVPGASLPCRAAGIDVVLCCRVAIEALRVSPRAALKYLVMMQFK